MLALCWQCFLPLTFLVLVKTSVRSVLIIIPTFQMRKLRHRVVKSHAWDHTFRMWKIRIKIHENWYIAPYTPKKKITVMLAFPQCSCFLKTIQLFSFLPVLSQPQGLLFPLDGHSLYWVFLRCPTGQKALFWGQGVEGGNWQRSEYGVIAPMISYGSCPLYPFLLLRDNNPFLCTSG